MWKTWRLRIGAPCRFATQTFRQVPQVLGQMHRHHIGEVSQPLTTHKHSDCARIVSHPAPTLTTRIRRTHCPHHYACNDAPAHRHKRHEEIQKDTQETHKGHTAHLRTGSTLIRTVQTTSATLVCSVSCKTRTSKRIGDVFEAKTTEKHRGSLGSVVFFVSGVKEGI